MSQYKYIHNNEDFVVYKFPSKPKVSEILQRKKITGWRVEMEVVITCRDNKLKNGRWECPTADFPIQTFDLRYTQDQMITYFLMHHAPQGIEISESEYLALKENYYSASVNNKL
jgi:hypothetical protein